MSKLVKPHGGGELKPFADRWRAQARIGSRTSFTQGYT